MNPCSKGDGGKQFLASSGLPSPFHPLKISQLEQHSIGTSSRVKRRRTKRERNYVKFGRNVTDRASEQRPKSRGLRKRLPPFWGSQLSSCAPIRAIQETCEPKPVIITQNRLSQQHLGMFNREVKSADIERLLDPSAQQEVMEMTPLQRDSGAEMQQGDEIQSCATYNSHQKSMLSEQAGSSVNDSCRTNDDSLPTLVPAVPMLITENNSMAAVPATGAECPPSAAMELDQLLETQTAETETLQSNALMALNEKENLPPVPTAGDEANKGKTPVRELAQDLQRLLEIKAIFPGRNLIRETRQTVISALLEQKQTLPNFSGLVLHKKLVGGCCGGITQADIKSPADRNEALRLESKSSSGSRTSDQAVPLKKWRGRNLFLFNTTTPDPGHMARSRAEGKPVQREYLELFVEPETVDSQSFYLSAAQPYPHLLSEAPQHSVNSVAERPFASEEQCPPQEIWLRTAQHWEQGLREALWDPRSRQERTEGAHKLQKKTVSKRHCLPFITHSLGSINLSTEDKHSGHFPLVAPQRCSYVRGLSPEQWNLPETVSAPIRSVHSSQDLCGSQPLDLGLRTTARAACESQTSFDVLKSIWSPNMPSRRAKSHGLGYPHLTHQSSYSRELNSEQGQPKEFLELYNILPRQHCSSRRQNSQQEELVPARHSLFSVLSKPRGYCQKEQGSASNTYQFWGQTEALARMQGTRDKGCDRPGNQVCSLEQLLQMETAQQLRAFQQLPMSYFPPSEALEKMQSPHHTLQGHLLGQSSPEPWAFPRMKLY